MMAADEPDQTPEPPTASGGAISIIHLNRSFEAFGLVMDFLSRVEPFSTFEVETLANVIRMQLRDSFHLAAMQGNVMIGYAGWLRTTTAEANAWTEGRGILLARNGPEADAAALTVFAVTDPEATRRLITGARELNKGVRVFFKRELTASGTIPRKASVLNFQRNDAE
jgi:hypothetical protein